MCNKFTKIMIINVLGSFDFLLDREFFDWSLKAKEVNICAETLYWWHLRSI